MAIEPSPAGVKSSISTTPDGVAAAAPMFSLRVVNLEYYLAPPVPGMDVCYSKFQGRTVTEVPVVRIYGATPAGQKACLHLHQVFPYFYVPYDEDLPQDISDALAYVRSLASAIERAMKLASSHAAKKQHVHSCSLVRARRYYGYYPSEQLFIKIVLYHPQEVARISTLLLGGGIMNRKFQPHESHISYLLQLLIDQNLAGMSHIHLSSVKFRRPVPERPSDTMHVVQQLRAEFAPAQDANHQTSSSTETTTPPTSEYAGSGAEGRTQAHAWVESSIPAHWIWPSHYSTGGPFARQSTCELEVDASVEGILNRQELVFVPLHEAGAAIKLVQSLTPMWEEEKLRTGENGPAGAAAALKPSPDRFLPPPSALEHALRDSLFQIAQEEERSHHFELRNEQLLKSTQEMLLECSQAANTSRPDVGLLDTKSIGAQGWHSDEDGNSSGEKSRSQDELVNEHVIRTQLPRSSQEAEREVAELLDWMGASQEHESGDELDEEAFEIRRGLSQPWESPSMEAAMLQALSRFEQATQKECREILDCVNHDEGEEDEGDEDLEAALLEIDLEDVERGRTTIPQIDGASDACISPHGKDLLHRYTQHLNRLTTKRPRVRDPIQKSKHSSLRIPQNDGADDDEADFAPEPKRARRISKKESHKEKEVPKRPVWGMLPLMGVSSQAITVKQEKQVSKQDAVPRRQRTEIPTDEKARGSDVSLRALMRRKRERSRLRSKDSSLSGGSSIVGSQSEGEQSFGGMGVVKSEGSSIPEDSESQEQEVFKALGKVKVEVVAPDQGISTRPRDLNLQTSKSRVLNRDAEKIARSSQIESGTGEQVCSGSVYPVRDVDDSRGLNQRPETKQLPPKIESLSVKWDGLLETGDDRDCGGGGRKPHAEIPAMRNYEDSKSILVVEDEVEDAPLTQMNESRSLVLEKVVILQHGDMDDEDVELVEGATQAEVVKEITERSSAKVTLSQELNDATPQTNACYGFEDVVQLSQRVALGTEEDESHVIETQLAEHEILWRMEHGSEAAETFEDEFLGTILVQEREDVVGDLSQAPGKTERSGGEEHHNEPPPNLEHLTDLNEGTEAAELIFNDMSDISEDSFDFGSAHKVDDSDEIADASEEEEATRARLKPEGAPILRGEDMLHVNGVQVPLASDVGSRVLIDASQKTNIEVPEAQQAADNGLNERGGNLKDTEEADAVLGASTSGKFEGKKDSPSCSAQYTLIPFRFHQKPPSRDALMATLGQYNLRGVDYGGVFYGNPKDVPTRATVSAGLIFDVKSRDALDLPQFVFGAENKASRFSISRGEAKAKPADLRPGMGVPCHFENDGSVSYLLTPARPAPSRLAVQQWLVENPISGAQKHSSSRGERVFTMDANTGKLVPMDEAGSNSTTQDSLPGEEEFFRPASPKYDEKHVLATPMANGSQEYVVSSKRIYRRISDAGTEQKSGSRSLYSNPPVSVLPEVPPVQKTMAAPAPVDPRIAKEKHSAGTAKDVPKAALRWRDVSQITAPSPLKGQLTPLSQSGFRDPASVGAGQQITLMSIEVHSETRGNLRPDPRYDAVGMVVIDIQYDDETRGHQNNQTLVLLVDAKAASSSKNVDGVPGCILIYLPDELSLFKCFIRLVRLCDPDMLVGWEVQGCSLGLLAERAANLGVGLLKELSRTPPKAQAQSFKTEADDANPDGDGDGKAKAQELRNSVFSDMAPLEAGVQDSVIIDEWGRTNGSGLFIGGRIVLNLWRIMRGEVKLGIYTLEAVAEAVLRRRVPRIPCRTLTRWFARGPTQGRHRCISYYIDRAKLNFEIMDQLDLLNRTAELARVFGIDFYSVFSRGSQYRVESMMLRLAHTQNFLLLSPSKQQVAAQPAMECLPLVMEPESRFYTSPVVVLDFQSLYPSMIIAYNLCFSTCLGKIVANNPKVLGVTNLPIPPGLLQELKDLLTITPNGVMYTPPEVRQGVVPRLLSEILSTRIMVKQAMKKLAPDRKVLQRVLNARQFALKLIANVTYGYTAAGFSGRMPCAELADSIVQCGRLTLERAIHLVNTTKRWDARVVYGDTDSMFVHLEGRTREEAFRIGQEIAASVTAMNPNPVTLKMEKVYHPCVLLTKKRYVGYSYESPGQLNPTFDAKGIETIRRDSCAAVAKTLERSLRTLFETQDLSQVKAYLQRQWGKIVSGRVSLRDFVFAKEVRLGTYSARASVLPAAAIVASKAMSLDPRAEPRYAERIPYVVVHGEPGARLSDVVVDPHVMLANGLRLHDTYYITKQIIPALQRIFGLVGADLRQWYAELPRVYRPPTAKRAGRITTFNAGSTEVTKGGTIDHYYLSQHCSVCGELMRGSQLICSSCAANPQAVVSVLTTQTAQLEKEFKHLEAICRHCGGGDGGAEGHIACVSLDCPIFFERLKVHKELQALSTISANCGYYPTCFLDFGSELF